MGNLNFDQMLENISEQDHRVQAAHFFKQKCPDEIIIVANGFNIASTAKRIQIKPPINYLDCDKCKTDKKSPEMQFKILRLPKSGNQSKIENDELLIAAQPWIIQSKNIKEREKFLYQKLTSKYPNFNCHVFCRKEGTISSISDFSEVKAFAKFNSKKNQAYGEEVLILFT